MRLGDELKLGGDFLTLKAHGREIYVRFVRQRTKLVLSRAADNERVKITHIRVKAASNPAFQPLIYVGLRAAAASVNFALLARIRLAHWAEPLPRKALPSPKHQYPQKFGCP